MRGLVQLQPVGQRRAPTATKKNTLAHHLLDADKKKVAVFKKVFLSILGMKTDGYTAKFK